MLAALQSGVRPREARIKVFIPVCLRGGTGGGGGGGDWCDAVIHNVSSRGLMAGCDRTPRVGSYVELRRGTLIVVGKVMWAKGRFFGLRSQDRLSVQALMAEPGKAPRLPAANDAAPEAQVEARWEREARLARRVERSRAFAAAFQYVVIAAVVLAMAGLGGTMVYDALHDPLAAVERSLAAL
jgi:hypothetical protein